MDIKMIESFYRLPNCIQAPGDINQAMLMKNGDAKFALSDKVRYLLLLFLSGESPCIYYHEVPISKLFLTGIQFYAVNTILFQIIGGVYFIIRRGFLIANL